MNEQIKIVGTNVQFDNTYSNVVRFKNREEQEQFFNLPSLFQRAKTINFDFGNEINTRAVVNNYEVIGEDYVFKEPFNYLILSSEIPNGTQKYKYYFITNFTYLSGRKQVALDLELDVFQTFMFDLAFNPCLIERKPLKTNINDVNFLTKDNLNTPNKRSLEKRFINFKWCQFEDINNWLKENIFCWQYTFISIDGDKKYKIGVDEVSGNYFESNILESESIVSNERYNTRELGYGVIITPIYKNALSKKIRIIGKKEENYYSGFFDIQAYNDFWLNNNKAYIYGIKNSIKPPVEIFTSLESGSYEINSEGNLLLYNENHLTNFTNLWGVKNQAVPTMSYGLVGSVPNLQKVILFGNVQKINEIFESEEYNLQVNESNPKVLDLCYNLKITNNLTQYNYNLLMLKNNNITFLYNEIITPEISKSYLRIKPEGYYTEAYAFNLNGSISSQDTSVSFANDKFSEFLANNKNFWMQTISNLAFNYFRGTFNNAINAGMSLATGNVTEAIGAGVSQIGNSMNVANNVLNTYFSIDNMKNAPASLALASGNIFFVENIENLQPYFELEQSFDNDITIIKNYLNAYHYSYGKIEELDITKPIFNRFNFYKCNIETFKSKNLINVVREKIKQIFANGVRIWENVEDLFNLTIENKEIE